MVRSTCLDACSRIRLARYGVLSPSVPLAPRDAAKGCLVADRVRHAGEIHLHSENIADFRAVFCRRPSLFAGVRVTNEICKHCLVINAMTRSPRYAGGLYYTITMSSSRCNNLLHRCHNIIGHWIALKLNTICIKTRKPSYRWQTRATRNPAKIAPIRRAYNVVADNIGLS